GQDELRARDPAVQSADDHIAAADELWSARLVEHHIADSEERGHHRNPEAESAGQHGAPHRTRHERSERQTHDHRDDSSTMRPSPILSSGRAREATGGSWATTTTAVPSA